MEPSQDRPALDAVERRVLGSLLEKERTVPASYPMTGNGLRTACNQSSGRDPILDLDDRAVTDALDRLKAAGLVRFVHAGSGARVVKYRQVLDERLDLDGGQRAVITLLLLRGPQTPGELRSRAERLHPFGELGQVELALTSLRDRPDPLVRELDRRPGQKERRWVHLLGDGDEALDQPGDAVGSVAPATGPAVSPVLGAPAGGGDTESVLADGAAARDAKVDQAYDTVAEAYGETLADELDGKPFDRWILERLVDLAGGGPVADVGCGPGHVAFHLAAAGAAVTGFDRAPAMVDEARRRFGELPFVVADLADLPAPEGAAADGWSAVVAWYSLVHLAGSELRPVVAGLAGGLVPGGWLGVAVHVGGAVRHVDESFGRAIDVDLVLHDPALVLAAFATAGLTEVEWYQRGPLEGVEMATERLYVLGRRAP